jgi:guanosine-diphosphatase
MHSEKSIMTQRSRLVKAGLIIAGAFLFLLYLVPSRQSVPNLSGELIYQTVS